MKQLVQQTDTGRAEVREVPAPCASTGKVLVRTAASLVSAGTERMIVDFAEKNLLQKARSRPDLVRQTVDKARREGILSTWDAVRNKMDRPMALGYSCAGTVIEMGSDISDIQIGDRVACAGGGYAVHAEVVAAPRNLVAKIPDGVDFESAAFSTLGAIALQGLRLADVKLGEVVAVIGLGLLGQLAVQMLKAAGCVVVGMDIQPQRTEQGRRLGADAAVTTPDDLAALCRQFSDGHGADAVLIAADTKSNAPVELAGEVARDKGVVVAVGAVGTAIPRKLYYEKELDFRISRSYGPGRYDAKYEEQGYDYPYAYVRWTQQRNMLAFLQMLASETVKVQPLITHRFPIEAAPRAYDVITGKAAEPFLGVVITYPRPLNLQRRVEIGPTSPPATATPARAGQGLKIGLLGAGNFALATLLPAMKKVPGVELVGVSTSTGLSARHAGDKFGFRYCATDERQILDDPQIDMVVVATRHDLHAQQAIACMEAGKDVFVEKPLALNETELTEVLQAQQRSGRRLMVGFNRRFAPMVREMQRFLAGRQRPLVATCRVNAGFIPADHWTQCPETGGGRIIGEACHFIDLLQFLIGAPPVQVYARAVQAARGRVEDEAIITLDFADGSVGMVVYAAGGDKSYGKERIEVLGAGRMAVLDDYRSLELIHGGKRKRRRERMRPDKGHRGEWQALAHSAQEGAASPIPLAEIVATHRATFAAVSSLRENRPVATEAESCQRQIAQP
jgi:predicted dehydrogenase